MTIRTMLIGIVCSFIVISSTHGNPHYVINTPNAISYMPWRETYISQPTSLQKKCIFCSIPEGDSKNPILYHGTYHYVILNNKPYINNGYHFLVIPYHHEKHLHNFSSASLIEMDAITTKICSLFSDQSYEIQMNYNIGTHANASIPDHLHQHIICTGNDRCYNLINAIEESTNPVEYLTQYEHLKPLFSTKTTTTTCCQKKNADCYYCSIIQAQTDQKNLIIHRGKFATILFNHYPFCTGEILVIPNDHYDEKEKMPNEVAQELWSLVIKIYSIVLSLLNVSDITIGMVSYGEKSTEKNHIVYHLTPRISKNFISPIMRMHPIENDITALYKLFIEQWNTVNKNSVV